MCSTDSKELCNSLRTGGHENWNNVPLCTGCTVLSIRAYPSPYCLHSTQVDNRHPTLRKTRRSVEVGSSLLEKSSYYRDELPSRSRGERIPPSSTIESVLGHSNPNVHNERIQSRRTNPFDSCIETVFDQSHSSKLSLHPLETRSWKRILRGKRPRTHGRLRELFSVLLQTVKHP